METLGLRFVIDTNLIDNASSAMTDLWTLHDGGAIQLLRTDVMDTELEQANDPENRARLLSLSTPLVEQLGVWVWDHSRWDHSVWGCEQDGAQFELVWNTLSPGRDRATADRRHVRDAMHVWTAWRYGADGFLTLDGSGRDKGLLDRAAAVREAFDFALMSPTQARDFAHRMLQRQRKRTV